MSAPDSTHTRTDRMIARLARAIGAVTAKRGRCDDADLVELGFKTEDVSALGAAARAVAEQQ